jgi:hypothetical protein
MVQLQGEDRMILSRLALQGGSDLLVIVESHVEAANLFLLWSRDDKTVL